MIAEFSLRWPVFMVRCFGLFLCVFVVGCLSDSVVEASARPTMLLDFRCGGRCLWVGALGFRLSAGCSFCFVVERVCGLVVGTVEASARATMLLPFRCGGRCGLVLWGFVCPGVVFLCFCCGLCLWFGGWGFGPPQPFCFS